MIHRLLPTVLLLAASAQAQSFQPVGSIPLGFTNQYAIADFNLDGRLDFARAAAVPGTPLLALGAADGSFTASPNSPILIDTPTGLVAGDFDNDGKPDLAVLTYTAPFSEPTARILLGSGTGTFTVRPAFIVSDLVRAAATGDFDQDGNLDLAIVTAPSSASAVLTVLRGNGKGDLSIAFLSTPVTLPVPLGSVIGDIQSVDLNGDKRPDLVITASHSSGVGLVVALGDGRGSFTATASMGNQPPQSNPNPQLAVADFNGDRNLDVVMFGYFRNQVTLWTNSGGGVLTPLTSTSSNAGVNPYSIAAADFDLDGRMDWVIGREVPVGGTPELFIGLGNGAGAFTVLTNPFPYGGPTPLLETGDFNGDRRTDLLVLEGNAAAFRILLNSGTRPPTLLTQQILFPQPADRGLNDGPLTLSAAADSGLPVVFVGLTNTVCTVSKGVATFLTTGVCTVLAIQSGDQTYSPAPLLQRSFTVARTSQTITFAPLTDRTLDASPFTLTATASSGLPVSFIASPPSVCTVAGNVVTLVATGLCTVSASQPGNTTFPAAPSVTRTFFVQPVVPLGPSVDGIANAASYTAGTLAPGSYGALFGVRLGPNPVVKLRDSAGSQQTLVLTFSGDTQINFIVPASAARGPATITVTTPGGSAEFPVTLALTAPGLFSATGTGQGLAAAQALIVNNDKTITTLTVGDSVIPVRFGTEIYLVLYGTGLRAHTPAGVSVTVAGIPVEVLYAGAQGTFPALDQINVRIPLSLGGFGTVDIRLTVDGTTANVVTARFQ